MSLLLQEVRVHFSKEGASSSVFLPHVPLLRSMSSERTPLAQ